LRAGHGRGAARADAGAGELAGAARSVGRTPAAGVGDRGRPPRGGAAGARVAARDRLRIATPAGAGREAGAHEMRSRTAGTVLALAIWLYAAVAHAHRPSDSTLTLHAAGDS